ncbi:hypothetical protein C8R41DRAFT_823644 [Lentinula lateritia]|uniref:Transmembrane protein n=1 Tax=Lentinula lateritia TaxID=40482 RepID=A0ABQ8VLQ5_9AGAR|nr:hypothetical protein C8R41DRAFT_823644 [Lentinula lateritia]
MPRCLTTREKVRKSHRNTQNKRTWYSLVYNLLPSPFVLCVLVIVVFYLHSRVPYKMGVQEEGGSGSGERI